MKLVLRVFYFAFGLFRLMLGPAIWIVVVYFNLYFNILAISMIREQSTEFFIFHVDFVPTGDLVVKTIFLVMVLLTNLGLITFASIHIYLLLSRQKTKNAQSENHSS